MKSLNTIKRLLGSALALTILVTASLAPAASAVPYDPNGFPTNKTPIFNHVTGVPNGIGNEADFVRIKPKAGTNADYVNDLTGACAANDAYTVRTYIHNGADPRYNELENGIAIAKNTVVRMNAQLTTANKFKFDSTISSSNAASVSDDAYLTCANGKTVKLELVQNSVQTYSKTLGFQGAPDSSVNGSLAIGSRVQGSGNVYACWDDRVTVTYEVKVVEVPAPKPSLGECKLLKVDTQSDRRVSASVTGEVNNATIIGYRIDFGDGTVVDKQTANHQYAKDGTYTITAQVLVKYADGKQEYKTASTCKAVVKIEGEKPPTVVPPTTTTPPSSTPGAPSVLPATGPAGVAALATLVSAVSGAGYYIVNRRKALL